MEMNNKNNYSHKNITQQNITARIMNELPPSSSDTSSYIGQGYLFVLRKLQERGLH